MTPHYLTASDGKSIAYYVDDNTRPWANAPTLLLMHSAMGNSQRFFSMVPDLSKHFRVVRFDLRGHGLSHLPTADEHFALGRLVQDALEVLDRVGAKQAHIVGNSAGGYVAQRIAIEHPDRALSLTTYGSTPGLNHAALGWLPRVAKEGLTPFLADTIAMRFDLKLTDPALVQWFLKQTGECNPAFIGRFITEMASHAWGHELPKVRCPTLVVYPGEETVGGTDGYEPYKAIGDVKLIAYDHLPHNICDMVPDRCVADLLDFLTAKFG